MGALGLSRTTMDTARIAGALVGAGLFAALVIGRAYIFVAGFYAASFALTLGVSRVHPRGEEPEPAAPVSAWASRWRDLRDGLAYVWTSPPVLAIMWLAFLVNLTAFPFSHSLMPYAAREIYALDAQGLSHLVAGFASGALTGSLILAMTGWQGRTARFTIVNVFLWYALIAVFAWQDAKPSGIAVLYVMGIVHSLAMVSMSGVLLRLVAERYRGRVMGIRMLAVYGLPIGLMTTSPLIETFGYPLTASLYVAFGIALTALIAWRWRRTLLQ
jgi:hypothetical protein